MSSHELKLDELIESYKLGACIQCGRCSASCPAGRYVRFLTRKLVHQARLGIQILDREELWYCTTCYTCYERCPKGVNAVDAIIHLRNLAASLGNHPKIHLDALKNIYNTGNAFPLSPEISSIRKMIGLKPSHDLSSDPVELDKFREFLDAFKLSSLIKK